MKPFFVIIAALLATQAVAAGARYAPGVCEGSARTGRGTVKVEVIFTETAIKSAEVVKHRETPGLSDKAILVIPKRIVARQSTDVAVVTGASVTSRAVRRAVRQCVDRHRIQN